MTRLKSVSYVLDSDRVVIGGDSFKVSPAWFKALGKEGLPVVVSAGDPFINKLLMKFGPSIYYSIVDFSGKQTGIYLRSLEGRFHFTELGSSPFLFSFKIRDRFKLVFVVEGLLDLLSVEYCYPSVMATCSSGISNFQLDWMKLMRTSGWKFTLVFLADNDAEGGAGLAGFNQSAARCKREGINAFVFQSPYSSKDPGELYADPRLKRFIDAFGNSLD